VYFVKISLLEETPVPGGSSAQHKLCQYLKWVLPLTHINVRRTFVYHLPACIFIQKMIAL